MPMWDRDNGNLATAVGTIDERLRERIAMTEAMEIRLHRARSWQRKARTAANNGDLNSQFIFLWISFNALYGTPRYRRDQDAAYSGEVEDFTGFLDRVQTLSRGQLDACLERVELDVQKTLLNPFLNIDCWRKWDRAKTRNREERIRNSCNTYDKEYRLDRIILQIYTLRNQILHGAATDASRRTHDSLKHAIPILDAILPTCIAVISIHGAKFRNLEQLPFPPSVGDGGQFNAPRLKKIAEEVSHTHDRRT
jgi:hypothetical protein